MPEPTRKLAAIVFTDIVGFTKLSAENEPAALSLLEKQRELLKPIVEEHHGSWLKEMGDGLLLTFNTNLEAVNCAIAIQNAIKEIDDLNLRIGIHNGEVVFQGSDVMGDDVNIASRIEPFSAPGGIAISGRVNASLERNPEFTTRYLGKPQLKGVSQSVKAYCIISHNLPQTDLSKIDAKLEPVGKSKNIVMYVAGIAIILLLGFYTARNFTGNSPNELSIAVLPFANMSADIENEYFSDGITEEILNSLAQIKQLHVAARTSSFAFKGKNEDIRKIGKKLSVANVLEGSVRKFKDDIRVTAQLIRVNDGFHLWSETYDRKFKEIFKVQEELSDAIAEEMKIKLIGENFFERRGITTVPEALDLYMKGRFLWNENQEKPVKRSIEYFELAIQKDPNYALAYSAIADAYYSLGVIKRWTVSDKERGELFQKAEDHAKIALQIEPELGEAYAVLGTLLSGDRISVEWKNDREKSKEYFIKAIELNPNYVQSYLWFSNFYLMDYNLDESEVLFNKALKLDPLSAQVNLVGGRIFYSKSNYEKSLSFYDKAFAIDPYLVYGGFNYNYTTLLEKMYQWDRAEKSWEYAFETDSTFFGTLWGYTMHHINRNDFSKAQKYLTKLKKQYIDNSEHASQVYPDIYYLEAMFLLAKDKDYARAIELLKPILEKDPHYRHFSIPVLALCFKNLGMIDYGLNYFDYINKIIKEKHPEYQENKYYLINIEIGRFVLNGLSMQSSESDSILMMIDRLDQKDSYGIKSNIYLFGGDISKTIDILEILVNEHKAPSMMVNHPMYDSLRDEERFQNLLSKMNLN